MFLSSKRLKLISTTTMVVALAMSTIVHAEDIGKGVVNGKEEKSETEIVSTGKAAEDLIIDSKGTYDVTDDYKKVIVKADSGKVTINLIDAALYDSDSVIDIEKNNNVHLKLKGDSAIESEKDSIKVNEDSSLTISGSGKITIVSDNSGISGNVTINNGKFDFNVDKNAINSNDLIDIKGGTFDINSREEAMISKDIVKIEDEENEVSIDIDDSNKGIKAKNVSIKGGDYNIDTREEAIDAEKELSINKSNLSIKTSASGIKSDGKIIIKDSEIEMQSAGKGSSCPPIDSSNPLELENTKILLCGTKTANMPGFNTKQKINEWEEEIKDGNSIRIIADKEDAYSGIAHSDIDYVVYSNPDYEDALKLVAENVEKVSDEENTDITDEEKDTEKTKEDKDISSNENGDEKVEEIEDGDIKTELSEDEENTEEKEVQEEAAKIIKDEDQEESDVHPVEDASPLSSLSLSPDILQASNVETVTFDNNGGSTSASTESTSATTESTSTTTGSSNSSTETVSFGDGSTSSTSSTTASTESTTEATTESTESSTESTTESTESTESTTESSETTTETNGTSNLVSSSVKTMDVLMRIAIAALSLFALAGIIYKIRQRKSDSAE